jgi:hypothetical protein
VEASLKTDDGAEYDLSCEPVLEDASYRSPQNAGAQEDEPDELEVDDDDDDW